MNFCSHTEPDGQASLWPQMGSERLDMIPEGSGYQSTPHQAETEPLAAKIAEMARAHSRDITQHAVKVAAAVEMGRMMAHIDPHFAGDVDAELTKEALLGVGKLRDVGSKIIQRFGRRGGQAATSAAEDAAAFVPVPNIRQLAKTQQSARPLAKTQAVDPLARTAPAAYTPPPKTVIQAPAQGAPMSRTEMMGETMLPPPKTMSQAAKPAVGKSGTKAMTPPPEAVAPAAMSREARISMNREALESARAADISRMRAIGQPVPTPTLPKRPAPAPRSAQELTQTGVQRVTGKQIGRREVAAPVLPATQAEATQKMIQAGIPAERAAQLAQAESRSLRGSMKTLTPSSRSIRIKPELEGIGASRVGEIPLYQPKFAADKNLIKMAYLLGLPMEKTAIGAIMQGLKALGKINVTKPTLLGKLTHSGLGVAGKGAKLTGKAAIGAGKFAIKHPGLTAVGVGIPTLIGGSAAASALGKRQRQLQHSSWRTGQMSPQPYWRRQQM